MTPSDTPAGPTLYVDADACPVKDEVLRVAGRHGLRVRMVSNAWFRLPESPLVERVVVSGDLDAADDWIVSRIAPGDIAVTADIPLAARCLKTGAAVLGPTGRPFTEANIGQAVASRDLMAHLRDTGEIRGSNPAFTKQDRIRFLDALEKAARQARRPRG